MAYDIPSISDLEAIQLLNKHYAEVITSKKDGIASGPDITQTTNPITGVVRRTLYKILDDMDDTFLERLLKMAFTRVGTFTTGATLTDMRQTLLWEVSQGGDGHEYGWTGSFAPDGKVIPNGSTPATSGGIGAGAWVDRTDVTLRSELSATGGARLIGTDYGISVGEKLAELSGFVIDVKNTTLQQSINDAVSSGKTLILTKNWINETNPLSVNGSLSILVLNELTISFLNTIDITNSALITSVVGELNIFGAKLTIDALGNTSDGAIILSKDKIAKFDNELHLNNLPNGTAYYGCAAGVNQNTDGLTGNGYAMNLHTNNVAESVLIFGVSNWYEEFPSDTASFILGKKSVLKASYLSYLLNKLMYAEIESCQILDSNGFYKSFDTDLSNGDWTATGSTISQNSFTTTANGGVYTTIDEIEIGATYYVLFSYNTTSSFGIEVRNGTSGTSPLITNVNGQVGKFTAVSKSIYLRQIGAGTTQISDFAIWKSSETSSNIYQCGIAKINGTRYIGVKRGPVVGIDCKNFDISNTKSIGVTLTGLDIDTESLAGTEPLYPDAYGNVHDNLVKYAGQRGLYSTCRRVKIHDNQFYYASDCPEATIKSCMRFNTRNETESDSGVEVYNNTSIGQNATQFVSVYRGKIVAGNGNKHDSTSNLPYGVDNSGDYGDNKAAVLFCDSGSRSIKTLTSSNNVMRSGDKLAITDSSISAISLLSYTYGKQPGYEGKIIRANGNTSVITISVAIGTINGGSNAQWPADKSVANIVCYSDLNDYIVTFSGAVDAV